MTRDGTHHKVNSGSGKCSRQDLFDAVGVMCYEVLSREHRVLLVLNTVMFYSLLYFVLSHSFHRQLKAKSGQKRKNSNRLIVGAEQP